MRRPTPGFQLLVRQALKNQEPPKSGFSWETIAKILGIVLSVLAFFLSYLTYQDSEKWKKADLQVAQFRLFQNNNSVKLVNQILDYDSKDLPLFKPEQLMTINENDVDLALTVDSAKTSFDLEETKLREVFDEYFDELSLFNRYRKEGVMDLSVMKPYLSYQIKLLADMHYKRKSESLSRLQKRMWEYVDYYEFTDVKELCQLFGYNIDPKLYPPPVKDEADEL